jgi:hypothetical protein
LIHIALILLCKIGNVHILIMPSKPHVAGLFGGGCAEFVPSPKLYKANSLTKDIIILTRRKPPFT